MKYRSAGEKNTDNPGGSNSGERKFAKKNQNRNKRRLGGGGLSLETFASLKSKNNNGYNPAIIKKQREFYKNAKYVSKYKKVLKKEDIPSVLPNEGYLEAEDGPETGKIKMEKSSKHKKPYQLKELYEKTRQEKEKARAEREAIIQAKEQARKEAESRRKNDRKMMFKKTRSGQPVMKFRIEKMLETLQGSAQN